MQPQQADNQSRALGRQFVEIGQAFQHDPIIRQYLCIGSVLFILPRIYAMRVNPNTGNVTLLQQKMCSLTADSWKVKATVGVWI